MDKPTDPPSPSNATSGSRRWERGSGRDPACGFRDIASSCPDFLPLPAGRRREIRLLGNEAPFPQKKPDLCAAGQRMLHFSFFFFITGQAPGGVCHSHRRASPLSEAICPVPGAEEFSPPTPLSASSPRPGSPQHRPRGLAALGAAPPPAPCPLRDRAPAAPSLSHAYLSGPAAEGLPPPAPAPRPVSSIPAAGVSHAAAPAQPRLSPCAHSAGAGSPAGFIRGQRRLRAAARLAANAAARLTLPRPGVTHGSRRVADPTGERAHRGPAPRPLPRAQRATRLTRAPSPTPLRFCQVE